MTQRYYVASSGVGPVIVPLPPDECGEYGKTETRDHTYRIHPRLNYTSAEAQQVVDWLNGQDQPLPLINIADRPGAAGLANPIPVMRPMVPPYRLID